MKKRDLVEALKNKSKITHEEAFKFVDLFWYEITKALINDDKVVIRGVFSFHNKDYGSYTGRNPKTGEKVIVSAKKKPFFKCGKKLKERVDYSNE